MTPNNLIRNFLYLIVIILVFSVQSAYGFLPTIFGYKIDILVPILISIIVLDYITVAIVCAGFIGFLYDFNLEIAEGFSLIYFIIIAILIHFLIDHYYTRNIITQFMFSTVSIFIFKMILFLFFRSDFLLYFQIISAETLVSIVLSPIAYLIVKSIRTNRIVRD